MKDAISDYEMYLYLSYLPGFADVNLEWLNCDFDYNFDKRGEDVSWWVDEGVKTLKKTMAEEIAGADSNAIHVVPLSGGLDSRAILGGLLENLSTSQIVTATYGIPGAWDIEIAKDIARKFGLKHEIFDLSNDNWNIDQLVAAATRLKSPVSVHQSYVRQKINNYFGGDCVYWSGVLGDSLAGSDLPKTPSIDRREAVKRNINLYPTHNYKDQTFQNKIILKILSQCPWETLNQKKYSFDQQIDLGMQQKQLTQNIVIFNGFIFKTPFLSKTWANFISNVPYKWLIDKYLYKKIIKKSYKELAKIGTTEKSAGMSLFHDSKFEIFLGKIIAKVKPYITAGDPYRSHPRTNYINWTESLRHKGSFQDSVYITLQDLKKREILCKNDIDSWWNDHLNRKTDYTILLMNLSSLELLLKAGIMV